MKPLSYERIWVFGDSFAAASTVGPHWSKFLANHYSIPEKTLETTNLGKPGTSLDFLYHEWNRTRHLITGNDLVVICATQVLRQWFNYPANKHPFSKGDLDQQLYVDYYDKIFKQDLAYIRLQNFLDAVSYWRSKRRIKNIVVLPCFPWKMPIQPDPNLIVGQGDLQTIHQEEVANVDPSFFLDYEEPKQKYSHLSEVNHKILAQKIAHAIDNNEKTIDLTQGFVKDIYDAEELKKHPRNEPIPEIHNPNKKQ